MQKEIILEMVQQLASLEKRPDSLFFLDDYHTALAHPALYQHGLIPMKDVKIISCGNEAVCLNVLQSRPATIDLVQETTGALAVGQLLDLVKSQNTNNSKISILINPE
ncbi:substrate-binding domain-containing protein [Coraliomargarita sp. W4R53]